jgi:phosphohistidine phosphatase
MPLQLLVLRHGHAKKDAPAGGSDWDRPLRGTGRRAVDALAPTVQALKPDLVLSSPSQRTRDTLDHLRLTTAVDYQERLYAADVDELVDAVRELSAFEPEPETVLLIGHNPSVHQLVLELTGGDYARDFPPSALAVLEFDVTHWSEVRTGSAQLVALHVPPRRGD